MEKRKMNKAILLLLLAILIIAVAAGGLLYEKWTESKFQVICMDVGKADAFLLLSKNSTVIIDTGLDSSGNKIIKYLKKRNRKTVDYLIITHFDKDHVGGADKIIKKLNVKNVVQSSFKKDSDDYVQYCEALEKKGITPITLTTDFSFQLNGISYLINPPQKDFYEEKESNNSSLIISVMHGENSFLFTGDAQEERITEFLNTNPSTYTFLKVPYHGHYQTILPTLFQTISPKYSVITSSDEVPEDQETLAALETIGSKIYLTRNGTVTCISDGKSLRFKQ